MKNKILLFCQEVREFIAGHLLPQPREANPRCSPLNLRGPSTNREQADGRQTLTDSSDSRLPFALKLTAVLSPTGVTRTISLFSPLATLGPTLRVEVMEKKKFTWFKQTPR